MAAETLTDAVERSTLCKCPKCSQGGRSVAAMNYSETRYWDKYGRFSGSGIGFGTGGIGVGFSSGTYSEHGKAQSKRARVFEEPAPIHVSLLPIVLPFILLCVAVTGIPTAMNVVGSIAPGGMVTGDSTPLLPIWDAGKALTGVLTYVGPIFLAFIGWTVFKRFRAAAERESYLNSQVLPGIRDRYNSLYYCEGCNLLFDSRGIHQPANSSGFNTMLRTLA